MPKIEIPQFIPDKDPPPEEVRQALFTLIAATYNGNSSAQVFTLGDLQAEGLPLGDWEIRVTRLDV